MATSIRPQEMGLLVAILRQVKGPINFDEASKKLGITVSAAQQRWGRLKVKINAKQEINLKSGDELTLLIAIAKQFGAGEIDFGVVASEMSCTKSAATQRWGRMRIKILNAGGPAARNLGLMGPARVTKPRAAPAAKKNIKKTVVKKENRDVKAESDEDMGGYADDLGNDEEQDIENQLAGQLLQTQQQHQELSQSIEGGEGGEGAMGENMGFAGEVSHEQRYADARERLDTIAAAPQERVHYFNSDSEDDYYEV